MSATWLDELERVLEERLTDFLGENPYQELLLHQQHHTDGRFGPTKQLHTRWLGGAATVSTTGQLQHGGFLENENLEGRLPT